MTLQFYEHFRISIIDTFQILSNVKYMLLNHVFRCKLACMFWFTINSHMLKLLLYILFLFRCISLVFLFLFFHMWYFIFSLILCFSVGLYEDRMNFVHLLCKCIYINSRETNWTCFQIETNWTSTHKLAFTSPFTSLND